MVAASPVIRPHIGSLIGIAYFCSASVGFIKAHILNQTAAAFLALEFDGDRGVRSVRITGVKTVNTAVFKLDGCFGSILYLYMIVTMVMDTSLYPFDIASQHIANPVHAVYCLVNKYAAAFLIPGAFPVVSLIISI